MEFIIYRLNKALYARLSVAFSNFANYDNNSNNSWENEKSGVPLAQWGSGVNAVNGFKLTKQRGVKS